MAKCEILLTTEDGQKVVGVVTFGPGGLLAVPVKGDEALMDNVLASPHVVGDKMVSRKMDSEAWFNSLPSHYNGSYLRARIVK